MAFLAAIPAAISSLVGGTGLSLGTALQAGGQLLSGVAAFGAANYQAKVAAQNAAIARDNAVKATEQASQQAQQNDNEMSAFIGQQEATQSASGVSTQSRSSVLTRKASARIAKIDRDNIIQQGEATANNYLQQAADFKSQANASKSSGIFNLAGSVIGAGSTLVGGATSSPRSTLANRYRSDPWITRSGVNMRVRTV